MGELLKFPGTWSIDPTSGDGPNAGAGSMWQVLIDGYTVSMRAAGRRPGTIRLHRHYLGLLARVSPDPCAVTRGDLERWMSNPSWSPEARKSARTVARMFYAWAASEGHVDASPAANLPSISVPAGEPRPAPQAAYAAAFALATHGQQTMLMLARYAGLRCCEIASVRGDDVVDGLLRVTGKGGKVRLVPILSDELLARLAETPGYHFPGRGCAHVHAEWISKQLGRLLPDGWTAHTLRHAFASRAYANNPDIYALAKVLGHSRVETTQRYTQMPTENLRRVVEAAA